METFMHLPEYADTLSSLAHFKVVHQPAMEPEDSHATQLSISVFSAASLDLHLENAVATKFSKESPNRGFTGTLQLLNCTATPALKVCTQTPSIGNELMRSVIYAAVFAVAMTWHELLIVDGVADFCDVDSAGLRSGSPELFRQEMTGAPWRGYSGVRPWLDVEAAGGSLASLGSTFQLADWVPLYADRLSGQVIHRDWVTGSAKPVEDPRWMGRGGRSATTRLHPRDVRQVGLH
mmetsp:Transcript_12110/g.27010  ORF Transcript_12110/g.27010 Transcript_12110/m.27010 type:complete len:235 (+) Transcript_12110:759-1463(+)